MYVGHILLESDSSSASERFFRLVSGLNRQGIRQHVLVSDIPLARRLTSLENVVVGPVVSTAVMAFCLLPDVDVAHVHDQKANQAGLVLRLTRSMPFVLTRRTADAVARNPIGKSLIERAATVICPGDDAAAAVLKSGINVPVDIIRDILPEMDDMDEENHVAAEHHRVYRRAADSRRIPALLI